MINDAQTGYQDKTEDTRPVKPINPHWMESILRDKGGRGLLDMVRSGIKSKEDGGKGLHPESFSFRNLALVTGVMDPYNPESSIGRNIARCRGTDKYSAEELLQMDAESSSGVNTNAFTLAVGELIMDQVISGYEDDSDFIGESLVTSMRGQRLRNQKMVGFTSLAGPKEVREGLPYEESGFEEKYVVTKEAKKGRILSLNEEVMLFDQTSQIMLQARELGFYTRQERERTIIRGVTDADSGTDPVYRPSGTGTPLYAADGSLFNLIGATNTTAAAAFQAASPLVDWTDIDLIHRYRATEVKDDRIDGTQRHIAGLNGPQNILLVPWNKRGTANYISNATQVDEPSDATQNTSRITRMDNPFRGMRVASSAFIDEQGGQALNDYFYGDFKKQFIWTEIWPLQTFTQGADSEAAFERDVTFRIKVRYYGGISARDTRFVTKVDGA